MNILTRFQEDGIKGNILLKEQDKSQRRDLMKVLSIRQHWASAIFSHGKDVENRTWKTNHRGDLLIHVSSTKSSIKPSKAFIRRISDNPLDDPIFGFIIGKVNLIDCVQNHHSPWSMNGFYHWLLSDPIRCEPFAIAGRLGLWDFDATQLIYLSERDS